MKTIIGIAICAVLVITSISVSYTQTSKNKSSPTTARESDITRGKYLVEEVAKCAECHTPRDAQKSARSRPLVARRAYLDHLSEAGSSVGGPRPYPGWFPRIFG